MTFDLTPDDRAAFRAFVREHHPDRGGDPEVFVAGLARFATRDRAVPPDSSGVGGTAGRRGTESPVEFVASLSPPLRAMLYLIRVWRRRYRPRVDRPVPDHDHPTSRRPR